MHIQDKSTFSKLPFFCSLSTLQALLPAGTFALGVAASSLVRQKQSHKRSTLREEEQEEVNAVARIDRLLDGFLQRYGEED